MKEFLLIGTGLNLKATAAAIEDPGWWEMA